MVVVATAAVVKHKKLGMHNHSSYIIEKICCSIVIYKESHYLYMMHCIELCNVFKFVIFERVCIILNTLFIIEES